MANIKSAKKRAKQSEKRRLVNLDRRTSLKTAVKKVMTSLEKKEDVAATRELLKDAEAKLSRAASKGLVHKNTAARKVSRLAKKINEAAKA